MIFIYVIFGLIILPYAIYLISKALLNTQYSTNENEFRQGKVTVNFQEQTVDIGTHKYNVGQVTGLRIKQVGSGYGRYVVIEVDDIKKPVHKIVFLNQTLAEKNAQRLSVALRKAGGPSFI